jgi:N-acetylglucosaminyl-diphospho-decaprenol L-rhamnosyltransferase
LSTPTTNSGITAVVVTHNSARHLRALGDALSAGSVTPARMLAVDNLSSDDTLECARTAGFDVLETGVNDGFGAGCNAGLGATDTEFVLFCNPDVRPSATAVEQLLRALEQHPTAAIAGAALDGEWRGRQFSSIARNIAGFFPRSLLELLRASRPTAQTPASTREPAVVDYVVGAFILCRVGPLRAVGSFDERFFLYCEEEDLSRRLRDHGWLTVVVPDATVAHEQRGSSEGFGSAAMAPFFTSSLYWYYRKHCSRAYAELARCVLAACVLLDRGVCALTRRPQRYGRGAASAPFRSAESVRRRQQRRAGTAPR